MTTGTSNRIRAQRLIGELWTASAPLTAVSAVMIVAAVVTTLSLVVDPRTIAGAPAWLKPTKFALSTTIYAVTLAWVFRCLPAWRRVRAVVGWTTAVVFVLEVGIIAAQAWRGTTSHFNVATPLDATLFTVMGSAIVIQTLMSVAVLVALCRTSFDDRALGWAMRWGLLVTIAGAATGGLMTRPTDAQMAAARAGQPVRVVGAHTVGAPDGGPGVPGAGWSREHGDIRVAHFVALHAFQLLPLTALALRRRLRDARRVRLVHVAAASYAGLFLVLLWQALRGQSVIAPDALTVAVLGLWLAATLVAAGILVFKSAAAARLAHVPA